MAASDQVGDQPFFPPRLRLTKLTPDYDVWSGYTKLVDNSLACRVYRLSKLLCELCLLTLCWLINKD